jgi:hypothetical protein
LIVLVQEAAPEDDVGTHIVGVELEPFLAQLDGVIYKPGFAIRIGERRKVPALGILAVALLELLDLAGVGHGPKWLGDLNEDSVLSARLSNRCALGAVEISRCGL